MENNGHPVVPPNPQSQPPNPQGHSGKNLKHEEGIRAVLGAIWEAVHYLEHNSSR
ncbi:hypothetical protein LINGRAHAP2_LOCUS1047, partial [Linum grandiflorum]